MYSMLTRFKKERSREDGFTLIELLVVILIIGILAAIAIPMFLNQRKAAVDSSVQSDVKNAATTIETWSLKRENAHEVIQDHVIDASTGTGTPLAFINVVASITPTGYTLSDGNVLHVYGTDTKGEFCIVGANAGGDVAATEGVFYDSTGDACEINSSTTKEAKADKAIAEAGGDAAPAPAPETGEDEIGEDVSLLHEGAYAYGNDGMNYSGAFEVFSNGRVTVSNLMDEDMMLGVVSGSGTVNIQTSDSYYTASITIAGGNGSAIVSGVYGADGSPVTGGISGNIESVWMDNFDLS